MFSLYVDTSGSFSRSNTADLSTKSEATNKTNYIASNSINPLIMLKR